ncbi:DEAD/DEAH box helicase [Methanobrevibacter smithii]|jgi:helicase|uniref:DEAD/DEAH box helicase n=2 Tax=Methanobrevibacter smithii TaxID=2173 RepID=A0A2H4U7E1_METSM|nr:DEAD/DEAH box helicase [Methanobrevibacter smithii]ATZ60038.1 DEAD/DEAH box helicase [Methanobrevibacter smithii]CDF28900.1 putative Ski2-type helicase [Methanobrevibacter smithii CAG:186]
MITMENLSNDIKTIINTAYPYIKEFNPAQKAVIESGYLEDKSNYIISIPTASGKTVLGILPALKTILNGGKAIYAAPLLSIQNEKVKEFKAFEEHGIKVGKHPSNSDLSVMVFESFDALTRFSWNVLREVDTLIIDEFHMIGEYSRGPTLESAITRAKIINPSLRIIALSATLKNIDEIEQWLDGKTVEHNYRPVPLNKEVLDAEMFNTKNKNDVIVKIVEKAIEDNSQALSFVSTRRFTESLATYVAKKIDKKTTKEQKQKFKQVADKLLEVPKKKGSLPTTTCLKLAEAAEKGVVFHHAGLFNEQKEIIEDEFRKGNILMITATPSLMYGVNLPSKYVVIRDHTRWTSNGPASIPVFDYEQMSGRAGRPQYDDVGYSYLVAKTMDEAFDLEARYVNGEIELTNSKLIDNKDAIYKQIIAQIASSLSKNLDDLNDFFGKTLYGFQMKNNPSMSMFAQDSLNWELESALEFLLQNGIIRATPEGLKTTDFGNLIAKSNYAVETAVKIKEYVSTMEKLNPAEMIYALAETPDLPLISFKGRKSKDPVRDKLSECGLFAVDIGNPEATAVSLIEWIDERNEYEIENAYNVYSASTRRSAYEASRLVKFAKNTLEVLGNYSNLKDMDYLSARLYYGVKEDIIPLVVGVKRLGRKRARLLMKTFGDNLSEASEKELQKVEGIGPKLAGKVKIFTMNH